MVALRRFLKSLPVTLTAFCFPFLQASSQPFYEIKADGTLYSAIMGAEQKNVKEITVYFVSTGNVSTPVDVQVRAPLEVKTTARFGFLGSATPDAILSAPSSLQAAKFRSDSQKKDFSEIKLTPMSAYPQYGEAHAWYTLQKDACSGDKQSKYITAVKLDLSAIPAEYYDARFGIDIAVKEVKWKGDTVASIKPSSDGKYKGEPILLMNTISYGNEYVNIVTWSKNKIVGTRRIPVVKYVGYKGYSLSLARLLGSLTGGRKTFELTNGADVYGVCLTAVRRRQAVNGYPSPN